MPTTQVTRWGNSLALRIPKTIAQDAHLEQGDSVTITVASRGSLVIRAERRKPRLQDLVSRIRAENRHEEIDWGPPRGKEVW